MSSRLGIIDLGTNTFHLLIAEPNGPHFKTVFHESRPVEFALQGCAQLKVVEARNIGSSNHAPFFGEQ